MRWIPVLLLGLAIAVGTGLAVATLLTNDSSEDAAPGDWRKTLGLEDDDAMAAVERWAVREFGRDSDNWPMSTSSGIAPMVPLFMEWEIEGRPAFLDRGPDLLLSHAQTSWCPKRLDVYFGAAS